jgi:very-short-patch-repair endonuclease
MIRTQLRQGKWKLLARGVYQIHPSPSADDELRALIDARLLQCGPSAFISHRTAALLYGFDTLEPLAPPKTLNDVEVSVPSGTRTRVPNTHKTIAFDSKEVSDFQGIQISTKARTVVDLSRQLSLDDLEMVVESALRGPDPGRPYEWDEDVLRQLERRALGHFHGAANLRAVLVRRGAVVPTGSGAETRAVQILRDEQLDRSLTRQVRVRIIGKRGKVKSTFYVDFAECGRGLVLEIDGVDHHSGRSALERDLFRQNELVGTFEVVRFTGTQLLRDRTRVVATIQDSLNRLEPHRLASRRDVIVTHEGIDILRT